MFIDELGLPIAAQENTEIIKPSDHTLQFYTVNEKYGHRCFRFSNRVEKDVLKIMGFVRHVISLLLCFWKKSEPYIPA